MIDKDGSVKLYRCILDSQVFANQTALKIWIWCLCKATFKQRFVSLKVGKGETTVKLLPGQFIFGRFKAENELNIDGSTIYKWIQKFSSPEFEMIEIKSNNQYSIITVCNWNTYQLDYKPKVTAKEQLHDNCITTVEQLHDTNKKDNNVKNDIRIPPEISEITEYCKERKNGINPNTFFDFYESKGWKIGKEKMKDWKASIRTWEKRNNLDQKPVPQERKLEYL